MNSKTKRIVLLAGFVILALALTGAVTGAIGGALMAGEGEEAKSFLSEPEPHLPPQKVFLKDTSDGHGESGVIGEGDGFVLTNTILSSWIVTILLIALFYFATRRMAMVPRGLQNFMEMAVEGLFNFVQGVAGAENARRFLPVIATLFFYVILNAWVGLLPFYPAIGFINHDGELVRHLLRPAGTDLNMPLALAIISFIFVEFWGLRLLKLGYLGKFVRLENIKKRNFAQVPIDLFVGALELLSEFIRIVSFTFRLFGNMTAGEILLIMIAFLMPFVAILPFYFLELLVGFVQALIFAGLTLVFVVVAVTPHGEEEHS